jgi:beta-mannosidase
MIHHGNIVTQYLARGVVQHLMPDISYTPSSPYSITDVGNESQSGDTHGGSYESAFKDDILRFREHIDQRDGVFMSEFGLHGPPCLGSLKKFISAEKLWPLNEVWDYRVQDNPYNELDETFVQIQSKCASALFFNPECVEDFIKVAGTFHSEYLYEEFIHYRRRQPHNNGALIWMFNDTWPCASWSVVDYYGCPKQPYYYLKRACSPIVLSFRETKEGWQVYLTHNLMDRISGCLGIEIQTVDGDNRIELINKRVIVNKYSSACVAGITNTPKMDNSCLIARFNYDGQEIIQSYFHNLWKNIKWPEPEIQMTINDDMHESSHIIEVNLKTKCYARCVKLSIDSDTHVYFSDNYFDLIPGQEKVVRIRSNYPLDADTIKINHWLETWE